MVFCLCRKGTNLHLQKVAFVMKSIIEKFRKRRGGTYEKAN